MTAPPESNGGADDEQHSAESKRNPPLHQAVGHACQTSAVALFLRRVVIDLRGVLGVIVGGDHAGSFALVSLLRIVAACPGNRSCNEW